MTQDNQLIDFGFKLVAKEDKEKLVANVFHSVADKYDLMNDVLSFGIHRLWKKHTIACAEIKKGFQVLDLAGGSGDFTEKFSPLVGNQGHVVLSDINESMLDVARERLLTKGIFKNVSFVQANAEALPFAENSFDVIVISFGLRNITNKDKALSEMYRVLKPGGKAFVLEFSKPTNEVLETLYNLYSFQVMPHLGQIIANDKDSYQYLAESIRKHPDQETLKAMMFDAGFDEVAYQNLTGGIVALHRGLKF